MQNENMIVSIEGRLLDVWDYETRNGRKFGHVVQTITGADDPHSMRRSRVIVTADRKLGPIGVDVTVKAELTGQVQDRAYTDNGNGQKKIFKDFRCYLNEIQ